MLASRRDALAETYSRRMADYDAEIRRLDSLDIAPGIVEAFVQRIAKQERLMRAAASGTATQETTAGDAPIDEARFARLSARVDVLRDAAARAAEARAAAADAGTAGDALKAEAAAGDARRAVLAEMDREIREARRREDALVTRKKAINGERTAAVSELGIKIGQDAGDSVTGPIQARIDAMDANLAALTEQIADARDFRMDLESLVTRANAEKAALAKEVDAMESELARLDDQVYKNTTNWMEWITRWPVLNALYSGNVRIEQNWLPDLTINYNFAQVARFDRCTTCHRAIAATVPGTATEPLFPTLTAEQRNLTLTMETPAEAPSDDQVRDDAGREKALLEAFGFALSPRGIISDAAVTVHYVLPESPAARAGLIAGDEVKAIAGQPPSNPVEARRLLLTFADWGQPLILSVRRGLNHPYTAHPRLDLYLSDLSPHPQKDVGCTICHDGQGSGTAFPWTSHTPNNANDQARWARDHGWFDNHHWIFPMRPTRFAESNCLKCHHQKGGLQPSERFPEPPAPKLVEGWTLVEDYGCFGCHEINGYDSPTVTVGPDVRLEPNFNEVAAQIRRDPRLTDDERGYVARLIRQPGDSRAREELFTSIKRDERLAQDPDAAEEARLAPSTHRLANGLKPVEMPGRKRKVGPSLRYLSSKVDYSWLYSWIREPADFRPSTKMPQFFGLYHHLTEADDAAELKDSLRFESIEIRALTEYLLNASDEFENLQAEQGVETPSADRGKWLFESRGCLACHAHEAFPGIAADQGPELSQIGVKLNHEQGRRWLYSWLKQPNLYHARTVMPDLYLEPIEEKDAEGRPTGRKTDPAADIAAFLMEGEGDWQPSDVPNRDQWSETELDDLLDLAVIWLKSDAIPASRARKYLTEGIDPSQAPKLKADELLLVNWPDSPYDDRTRTARQLEFVARRTIGKYGCFGCHDIPGFEDAKPIGTALADWGRKESSKLAFENIHRFLEMHGIDPPNATEADKQRAREIAERDEPAVPAEGSTHGALHAEHLDPAAFGNEESYFIQSLNAHGRDGFIWQKLRFPRSFDYKTTRNKSFNERLRMPRFPFTDQQREAVITFVLGLVKEPPAPQYVYRPEPRQQAIVDGHEVLEQFNCAGCHTLKMEQWQLTFDDSTFETPPSEPDFPFLAPRFTDQQMAESLARDYRGFMHATVHGEPVFDTETGAQGWVDEDLTPITPDELREAEAEEGEAIPVFYQFTLWRDALVGGETYLRGLNDLLIPADRNQRGPLGGQAFPAWGGDLARYLFIKVIEKAKADGSSAKPSEAWGWLPPPLMDEGEKVQPDWLHGFLMDPFPIRPAVVMRMPNFQMSSDEAAKLVDFFAATSGVEYPYDARPEQQASYLAELGRNRENPLAEAMQIVVNGTYCVKCHYVGDFAPEGDAYTFGPNLADVHNRLRPKFLRDWIAYPLRLLPYTGMPKNIPFHATDPSQDGLSQDLFRGTSIEQVMGLVNLLMNFDVYAKAQASVTPLVEASAAAATSESQPAGDDDPPPDEAASLQRGESSILGSGNGS
ncbi:MAG TPA: PDZ domain-containing protein [Lacipirellulaceae bacterium]|nr:PDZ domain-containing protein [Lacipirellulaceae bacterium]